MSIYKASQALIEAVHTRLSSNPYIQAVLGAVPRLYDAAPEDPAYPYLTYGAMRAEDISGDETPLSAHTLNLHVWSRYSGRKEAVQIIGLVSQALETEPVSLDGAKLISANVVYTDIFKTPDARTLHGILRINFVVQSETVYAAQVLS